MLGIFFLGNFCFHFSGMSVQSVGIGCSIFHKSCLQIMNLDLGPRPLTVVFHFLFAFSWLRGLECYTSWMIQEHG